jgi:CPA1 family monovalent cation:H+ antiporter
VAFPNRNLILFITFVVILVTLVGQGLSLSWLTKKLGLESEPEEDKKNEELEIRIRLAEAALEHMNTHYAGELGNFDAFTRLRDRYARMIELAKRRLENDEAVEESATRLPEYRKMLLEIVDVRRYALAKLREEKKFDDELLNSREWELDLEEARLNEQ